MNRVDSAIELIECALNKAKSPVVAFSGGKDSTVVLDLVRSAQKDVPAQFCNTGVEHPQTIEFIKTVSNLIELHPEKSFWKCVEEYGLPKMKGGIDKGSNRCCYYLKEKPAMLDNKNRGVDLTFTGLTTDENRNRWLLIKSRGPLYQVGGGWWKCHPIHDWTSDDVWKYIKTNSLPYNRVYDDGAKRCGCQPCTAYMNWKRNLARENPKLLTLVLKMQGQMQLPVDCGGGFA